jgi:GMP synthase (glutamine-hydrolysing)
MKRAVALLHVEFEGPGTIAEIVAGEGYEVEIRSLHRGDSVPFDLGRQELLIVMGGPMGVADIARAKYPYLEREVELLRQRVADDAPVLGICLGAQLLAHAAGATVRSMTAEDGSTRLYECGWGEVAFHHVENEDVLAEIPPSAPMLHWHADAFELPAGARRLASTVICPTQGFRLHRRLFGLQFHCETAAQDIENFLISDGEFVVRANGEGGADDLRRETARNIDAFRKVGARLLQNIVRSMLES